MVDFTFGWVLHTLWPHRWLLTDGMQPWNFTEITYDAEVCNTLCESLTCPCVSQVVVTHVSLILVGLLLMCVVMGTCIQSVLQLTVQTPFWVYLVLMLVCDIVNQVMLHAGLQWACEINENFSEKMTDLLLPVQHFQTAAVQPIHATHINKLRDIVYCSTSNMTYHQEARSERDIAGCV